MDQVRGDDGFLFWRTYPGEDSARSPRVLVAWKSEQNLNDACRRLRGRIPEPVGRKLFHHTDRRFLDTPGAAGLLRVAAVSSDFTSAAESESDWAVRALGAPGVVSALVLCDQEQSLLVTQLEFESSVGLEAFRECRFCIRWTDSAARWGAPGAWFRDLPYFSAAATGVMTPPAQFSPGGISVRISRSEGGSRIRLVLSGHLDRAGERRCRHLCEQIVAQGVRHLELDLAGLDEITPAALTLFLELAHTIRSTGGELRLIDNEERARRVLRPVHLQETVG